MPPISTHLQRLIWRDGFDGPICARAHWRAPHCRKWALFERVIDGVWSIVVVPVIFAVDGRLHDAGFRHCSAEYYRTLGDD